MPKQLININKFLGLNEQGNTQLQLGEAEVMTNFRLVDEYKPRVIEGYVEMFETFPYVTGYPIRGMWYGEINGSYQFVFACNSRLYTLNLSAGIPSKIGTINDNPVNFFFFGNQLYIQNGINYLKWGGSSADNSVIPVSGYIPIIAIATPPSGGGTPYEGINLLTGERRQWFSGNGTDKVFQIAEPGIFSIDYVKNLVTGTEYVLGTEYTKDEAAGKVTFTTAPANVPNNIEIKWTKVTLDRRAIEKCRCAISYNGANDTRVFLWGNPETQNRRYHSGLADVNGTGFAVPSAEYFPATNYYDIGSNQNAITDIVKQYDRQIIFTDGGTAFYSYYETGPKFPVFPLNDAVGNVALGQARIVQNNPFTLYKGVYQWTSTSVRDERNVLYMSRRVHPSMDEVDLSKAVTFDYEKNGELWIAVDNTILVYNYRLDAWYKFILTDTPTCFVDVDGTVYFGTTGGKIMKFDNDLRSFNGANIKAELYMGFTNAGFPNRIKSVEESYIAIKSENHSGIETYWETNKKNPKDEAKPIDYNNLDFSDINFNDWSFAGNYNPQPFKVKTKANNWVYFRHIFKLDSNYYTAQILEVTFEPNIEGRSK